VEAAASDAAAAAAEMTTAENMASLLEAFEKTGLGGGG
jgi:hypothetical protein